MKNAILMAVVVAAGCGGTEAPGLDLVAQCTSPSGVRIELVRGVEAPCAAVGQAVDGYRALYEGRWGPTPLGTVRAFRGPPAPGHSGQTLADGTVEFDVGSPEVLPHEFRHVAGHGGHEGWCTEFVPWECQVLSLSYCGTERAYLGCTTP